MIIDRGREKNKGVKNIYIYKYIKGYTEFQFSKDPEANRCGDNHSSKSNTSGDELVEGGVDGGVRGAGGRGGRGDGGGREEVGTGREQAAGNGRRKVGFGQESCVDGCKGGGGLSCISSAARGGVGWLGGRDCRRGGWDMSVGCDDSSRTGGGDFGYRGRARRGDVGRGGGGLGLGLNCSSRVSSGRDYRRDEKRVWASRWLLGHTRTPLGAGMGGGAGEDEDEECGKARVGGPQHDHVVGRGGERAGGRALKEGVGVDEGNGGVE